MNPEDFYIEQNAYDDIIVRCDGAGSEGWFVLSIRPDGVHRYEDINSGDVGFQTNEHGQIAVLKQYCGLDYAQKGGWNKPGFDPYTVADTVCTLGDVKFFLVKRDSVVYIMGKKSAGPCYTLMAITKDGLHLAGVDNGFGIITDPRKYGTGIHLRVWRNF